MNEPKGFRGFINRHNVKIYVIFGLLSFAGNLIVYRRQKIEGENFERCKCTLFMSHGTH